MTKQKYRLTVSAKDPASGEDTPSVIYVTPEELLLGLHDVIQKCIAHLAITLKIDIPKASCKNDYTRACWLVYTYQRLLPEAESLKNMEGYERIAQTFKKNIAFLQEHMELLKENAR
jgi:hypothetical protein